MKIELIVVLMLLASVSFGQKPILSADVVSTAKTNTFTVKGKSVTDYASTKAESWRFVHDGEQLILEPFFTGGTTYSPFKIVECKSFDIATNEIARLKLKVSDQQAEAIARLITNAGQIKDGKSP